MAEDGRLDKVKSGLNTLIDTLDDADRLALVEFDDTVQVEATFGATLDRAQLHTIVNGLTPGGGTDIFDGVKAGFDLSVADARDGSSEPRDLSLRRQRDLRQYQHATRSSRWPMATSSAASGSRRSASARTST